MGWKCLFFMRSVMKTYILMVKTKWKPGSHQPSSTTKLWQPNNHQPYNPLCVLCKWYWMPQWHTWTPLSMCHQNSGFTRKFSPSENNTSKCAFPAEARCQKHLTNQFGFPFDRKHFWSITNIAFRFHWVVSKCATKVFSTTHAVHIEDCDAWWFSSGHSSVVEDCWLKSGLPASVFTL